MTTKSKQIDVGKEVDYLDKLEEDYRAKNKVAEEAKKKLDEQKQRVMDVLESMNLEGAKGSKKSVTVGEDEVGKITDFERLWQFAKRGNHPQLFQRRLSNPAVQELIKNRKGKEIPGVEVVPIKKIYIRSR